MISNIALWCPFLFSENIIVGSIRSIVSRLNPWIVLWNAVYSNPAVVCVTNSHNWYNIFSSTYGEIICICSAGAWTYTYCMSTVNRNGKVCVCVCWSDCVCVPVCGPGCVSEILQSFPVEGLSNGLVSILRSFICNNCPCIMLLVDGHTWFPINCVTVQCLYRLHVKEAKLKL